MTRSRALLTIAAIAFGMFRQPVAAGAAGPTLMPGDRDARAGSTITMTGDFCGTGLTIESIDVSLVQPYPIAPIMTFPLDVATAGLLQTAAGFTFTYAVAGDRQFVWFTVRCSDGQVVNSRDAAVTVWPPYGELWFVYPYPTPAYGTAGETIEAVVHSIDCVEGSMAGAELRHGSALIATGSGVFTDHWLHALVDVPASTPAGEDYTLVVTCSGTRGGSITDEHAAVIAGSAGPTPGLPGTGGSSVPLAWLAAVTVAAGMLLTAATRRRSAR